MLDQIPEERKKEYQDAFDIFDKDKNGTITIDELANVMRSWNQDPSPKELKEMIDEVDLDGNGEIDFNEFVTWMNRRTKEIDIEEDVLNAFRVFDKERTGLISVTDLRHIMLNWDGDWDEEVEKLLLESDKDGSGFIKYETFIREMMIR